MVVLVSDATNFKPRVPQQSSSKPQDHQALPDLGAGVLWEVDLLSRHLGNLWKSGNLRFTTQLWTHPVWLWFGSVSFKWLFYQ